MNTEGYSAERKAAIRYWCAQSARSRESVERARLIVAAIRRTGQGDCLEPELRAEALHKALWRLAPTADPTTSEGRAIISALSMRPQSLTQALRRHPELLTSETKRPRTQAPRAVES